MTGASFSRVLDEMNEAARSRTPSGIDNVRRTKIRAVCSLTKRPLVIYATACLTAKPVPESLLIIEPSDKMGFQEVTAKITGKAVDVLVHSPGGMADATAIIVEVLRDRFDQIRFIVPFYAKSAATMLALSGNEILMTSVAELGPIDPQMPIVLPNGVTMYSPAYALKRQYLRAQAEVNADPSKLPGWIPTLSHPSRLAECDLAISQAKRYAKAWLEKFMLAGNPKAVEIADDIAEYLSDHAQFLSHGFPIRWNNDKLQQAKVSLISSDSEPLDDAVMDLYYAIDLTFQMTATVKFFENSLEPADFVGKLALQQVIQLGPVPGPPSNPPPSPQPPSGNFRPVSSRPARRNR